MEKHTRHWKFIPDNRCSYENLKGCTIQCGCCFVVWRRAGNCLDQYLILRCLKSDDWRGLFRWFKQTKNDLPNSTEWSTSFCQRCVAVFKETLISSVSLSHLFFPPSWMFTIYIIWQELYRLYLRTERWNVSFCFQPATGWCPHTFKTAQSLAAFHFCYSCFQRALWYFLYTFLKDYNGF